MTRRANGEGTEPRFDPSRNKWVVAYRHAGKRTFLRADTALEARRLLRQALADRDNGLPVATNKWTLKQYLADWLKAATSDAERRPSTLRAYTNNVAHISSSSVGKVRLGQLRPPHVDLLRREMRAKGLAERSVAYIHAVLRIALGDAVELELLPRNPAQVAHRKGRKRGSQATKRFEVVPLSEHQVHALFEAVRGERLEALFVMAVMCGLRRGELLGLRWADVDLSRRCLRVRYQMAAGYTAEGRRELRFEPTKTDGSERQIDLPDMVMDVLKRHRERQAFERRQMLNMWQDRDLVFCSEMGTALETTTLYRVWCRLRQKAGIAVRLHDLRHTTASLLLAAGVPLWEVSKIMGHASYQFTVDTYGHLYSERRREAADALQTLLLNSVAEKR